MAKDEPVKESTNEPRKEVKQETTIEKVVTDKQAPVHAVPAATTGAKTVAVGDRRHTRKWVIGIVAGIVVIYIIAVVVGVWVFHESSRNTTGVYGTQTSGRGFGGRGRFANEQTYNVQQSSSDGLTTTTTNTTYTQTQGVVTAVNSDNIVVAGGGKTQTIKTNSSTTYTNSTKPAVSDTVVVVGTKDSSGAITATQIEVFNYSN